MCKGCDSSLEFQRKSREGPVLIFKRRRSCRNGFLPLEIKSTIPDKSWTRQFVFYLVLISFGKAICSPSSNYV